MRFFLDGRLGSDSPLPSCRRLAHALGVSRNTVVLAYQALTDEGFLISRERVGYFVNADIQGAATPTSALKSMDREQTVVYVGSFSLSLAPGLHIGYLVAAAPLIAEALARAALEEGVAIEPGAVHFHGPERPRNTFRLGFSSIPVEKIAPGIEKLAQIIDRMG